MLYSAPFDSSYKNYRLLVYRRKLILAALLAMVLLAIMCSLFVGAYKVSFRDLLALFSGTTFGKKSIVLLDIRLPRTLASLVVGSGLAISGLALQSILKNPLASASTLGISQGAAFGAAFSVVVFKLKSFPIAYFAFVGSCVASLAILALGRLRRLSPEAIILAGVALSSLFSAATVLVQYIATETELAAIVFWTFGDVARSNWKELGLTTLFTILGMIFLMFRSLDFMSLEVGDDSAKGIGVSVETLRWQTMAVVAVMASIATAFHGVIAFVGLIAPHIARRFVGGDYTFLIPLSALFGGLLLLWADIAGRFIIGSGGLPVGVITSFLGAPLFLYLLLRGYR